MYTLYSSKVEPNRPIVMNPVLMGTRNACGELMNRLRHTEPDLRFFLYRGTDFVSGTL